MADKHWRSDTYIQGAKAACRRASADAVVAIYVLDGGKNFAVASYGRTKRLCDAAAPVCDKLHDYVAGLGATHDEDLMRLVEAAQG